MSLLAAFFATAGFLFGILGAINNSCQLHARWKESGKQMNRPAVMSVLKITAWLVLMCMGVALWMGRTKSGVQTAAASFQSASKAPENLPVTPTPDSPRNLPKSPITPKLIRPARPVTVLAISSEPLPTPSPQQSIPNGNIQIGSDNNNQTMVNSPGGMQAKGDIVNIGRLPVPDRVLLPEDITEARRILGTSKGSIAIVSFPTNVSANSEIATFTNALKYALSQENWNVWRPHGSEYSVGSFNGHTDMPLGPHGVGCDAAKPDSEEAQTVFKALAALKLYCRGPSVFDERGGTHPFTFSITVGTRIVPEQ